MKKTYFFLCFFSLFFTVLKADGTLTDAESTLNWRTTDGGTLDWSLDAAGTDQAFQLWFYYRINAQTSETILPAPDAETFVGNTATLNWSNLNGLGFDLEVTAVLTDASGNAAGLALNTVITNNSGGTLDIELFQYMDLDKGGTDVNDEARLIGTNLIEVTDLGTGDVCQFSGEGANAYQVTSFQVLRDFLEDGAINTLDNTGLPFGPGDWTGAFQWSFSIADGATATINSGSEGAGAAELVEVAPVPTLSQWSLLIFGLLILNLGIIGVIRKQSSF